MRPMPIRRRPVLAMVCVLVSMGAPQARAESDRDSPQQFLYEEHARASQTGPTPRIAPHHRAASTYRRILMHRDVIEPREVRWTVERRVLPRPVAPTPQRIDTVVAVYGDRFGQALAAGLQDSAAAHVAIMPQTTDDAALTRADFNDWLQSIRSRLGKPDRPGLAIVMLGSNDRQSLPDNGAPVAATDPRWTTLYAARVDAVAMAFRDAHVPLIWVGLPSVHNEDTSADFVRLNGIVRDRIAQYGATYVDSWEAFNDENGRYSPVGPDVEGQSVKLRKADGFGFTRAGARKLASFVESDVKRMQTPAPPVASTAEFTIETPREFDSALQIDVNAQIRREAGLPPEAGLAGAGVVSGTPKPAAGPVIALTAAPLSPGGALASPDVRASLDVPARDPAEPAVPRPGRADDFAWPKPQ